MKKNKEKWLVEFTDGERKELTEKQIREMEKIDEKFDGFHGWFIVKKVKEKKQ